MYHLLLYAREQQQQGKETSSKEEKEVPVKEEDENAVMPIHVYGVVWPGMRAGLSKEEREKKCKVKNRDPILC